MIMIIILTIILSNYVAIAFAFKIDFFLSIFLFVSTPTTQFPSLIYTHTPKLFSTNDIENLIYLIQFKKSKTYVPWWIDPL